MIKHLMLSTVLIGTLLSHPGVAAEPKTVTRHQTVTPQAAQQIHVGVNGMVCDFCAQSLKKTFAKKAGIDKVDISLETKTVTLHVPQGKQIDDATITKLITDAGYAVTTIHRM